MEVKGSLLIIVVALLVILGSMSAASGLEGDPGVDALARTSETVEEGMLERGARLRQDSSRGDAQYVHYRVEAAFRDGDIRNLSDLFSDQVEITILGDGSVYSRSQAFHVMRDFFRGHPADRFVFDEGTESGTTRLAMGSYWVRAANQPHRVFVRLRLREDKWEVKEIRIEQNANR